MHMNKWLKNNSGQALAETALILPILIFILMGIFVVGYWLYARQVVIAAAREGARIGSQSGDWATLDEAARMVLKTLDGRPESERINITAVTEPDNIRGSTLIVEVSYKIPFSFNFFKNAYAEKNEPYLFGEVREQAVARLETDFAD
ncbi:MAG: pilus assembly protein [Candidatus Magasanikbacteria bacterium]|nr:pilus assembly protein [Candidatus Magasanikbacteria bacterium]